MQHLPTNLAFECVVTGRVRSRRSVVAVTVLMVRERRGPGGPKPARRTRR